MLTRVVYGDNASQIWGARPARPGEESRRVPVIVIRTGGSAQGGSAEEAGTSSRSVGEANRHDGIDIPGSDYRLTLSPEALARDREVRGHERAHLAALGGYAASGINYTTRTGPDGESVAVGGRIAVDLAEVPGDPRGTLRKARTIYNAATAPGNPSAADMRVAAEAYRLMQKAHDELSTGFSGGSPRVEQSA